MSNIHYFGIRHHGPGSCKRLLAALEALQPECILIEGPTDCSELLPLLASKEMQLPVALLSYATDNTNCSIYYPFAEYSPEYQATLFAIENQLELAFIDVPANIQLAKQLQYLEYEQLEPNDDTNTEIERVAGQAKSKEFVADPIGCLAKLAGYQDGEAWWNDLIEQNTSNDEAIFATIESAMRSLRNSISEDHPNLQSDLVREAYMRLEIAKAKKKTSGPIAVVCGAWHVPALKEKHTAKSDNERVKSLPAKLTAKKVKATWIPWTSARLSSQSGYGAGVAAPMWYQHLWQQQDNVDSLELWLAKIANEFREIGHIVSTASVIETMRLCRSLATVRGRPNTGFEEIREAVIACLCFGEASLWQQIESQILLGNQVGKIPANAPLIPLIEDLQLQQKKHKLKPLALPKELSIDLRSHAGLGRSTLLHRLNILDIPWGSLKGTGTSRGTFREKWELAWQPEFSVKLVESLVYGNTIEQAASSKIIEQMLSESNLGKLAANISHCLEAQLHNSASKGLIFLEKRAAHTSDCVEILTSIAPLIDISRYGTARNVSLGHVELLIERLTIQGALAMPYACRNLNDDEAWHYRRAISDAHNALLITDWSEPVSSQWWQALAAIVDSAQSSVLLTGLAARLLYQAERLSNDELSLLMGKMLSRAVAPAQAAKYFEGFFSDAIDRLLYDDMLLDAIENWLVELDEEVFVEFLPLFRRIFSALDAMERKRLIDRVLQGRDNGQLSVTINENALASWPKQQKRLTSLIKRERLWPQ